MEFILETVKDTWARIALLWWIPSFLIVPIQCACTWFYLSWIVVIFTRETWCLPYLYIIDTTHCSAYSKLNFAIANFRVTLAFQIHCFSFLKCLFKSFCVAQPPSFFLTFLSITFFNKAFLIRRVSCSIILWFWWPMSAFLIEKISRWTRCIRSKQGRLYRIEPVILHQNPIWHVLTNQIR